MQSIEVDNPCSYCDDGASVNYLLESVTCTGVDAGGDEMFFVSGFKAPTYATVKPGCCMNQYSENSVGPVTMHAICKPDCKPPPPPPCKTCMDVLVLLNGPNSNYPPLDSADCGIVTAWLNNLPSSGCGADNGNLRFSCSVPPRTTVIDGLTYSTLTVCATGSDSASFVNSFNDICAVSLMGVLGYQDCDVFINLNATCAPSKRFGNNCQGSGNIDFPHSCFPGNSRFNGGVGGLTSGQKYTPIDVQLSSQTSSSFSFSIVKDQACQDIVPKEGPPPPSCCDMALDKFEMVMGDSCQGSVASIIVNGKDGYFPSYSNGSYLTTPSAEQFPPGFPAARSWYKVMKITGGMKDIRGTISVTVNLRPPCSSPATFLPSPDLLWFTYFNGPAFGDNCCGTSYRFYP